MILKPEKHFGKKHPFFGLSHEFCSVFLWLSRPARTKKAVGRVGWLVGVTIARRKIAFPRSSNNREGVSLST